MLDCFKEFFESHAFCERFIVFLYTLIIVVRLKRRTVDQNGLNRTDQNAINIYMRYNIIT